VKVVEPGHHRAVADVDHARARSGHGHHLIGGPCGDHAPTGNADGLGCLNAARTRDEHDLATDDELGGRHRSCGLVDRGVCTNVPRTGHRAIRSRAAGTTTSQ